MSRFALLFAGLAALPALADDSTRLFPGDKKPADRRLGPGRTLNDKDFFLRPPASLETWKARRQAVREQVLVATGLWPLPPRGKLKPVIHGRIDREGYSVEKVYFASLPGHYVTGNLYRPRTKDGKLPAGKLPAVLCPHGHWRDGRLHDAGAKAARVQVDKKAESTVETARYFHQARCAQLARMGCVVFFYDMVGYADSTAVGHSAFEGVAAELRLQNLMGLQTWNSIRAMDFLTLLPEVDDKRIGMTGASGGGTQTFILAAIDDRLAAAFPAVMVSTQMQGGCACENASYLRIGTGNVEIAAVFAPRPLAMSAAKDWTEEIERKGLPELKAIWKLYDQPDRVAAKCWPEFGHNYNQPAREMMYDWFNKHLGLKRPSPVKEQPFVSVPPAELRVFDGKHPRPADSANAAKLRETLTAIAERQMEALKPTEPGGLGQYRRVVGTALRVMLASGLPEGRELEIKTLPAPKLPVHQVRALLIGRRGQGEQVPALWLRGKEFNGTAIVWVAPGGKASLFKGGRLVPEAQAALDKGAGIFAVDVLGTGELALGGGVAVNPRFAGYTFGYNRPLLANRAHDVLTAVAAARRQSDVRRVHLAGWGAAGLWVLLARGLCGDAVARTAADVDQFRFERVEKMTDERMLPGALKYGGLPGLAALAAPHELFVHNHRGAGLGNRLKTTYAAAGATDKLSMTAEPVEAAKVVAWLLR